MGIEFISPPCGGQSDQSQSYHHTSTYDPGEIARIEYDQQERIESDRCHESSGEEDLLGDSRPGIFHHRHESESVAQVKDGKERGRDDKTQGENHACLDKAGRLIHYLEKPGNNGNSQ